MTKDEAAKFYREGVIDVWTYAEAMDIPNMGEPPSWARTITQRLQAQQAAGIRLQRDPPMCPEHPDQRMYDVAALFNDSPPRWMCPQLSHGMKWSVAGVQPLPSLTDAHYCSGPETPHIRARCRCGHTWAIMYEQPIHDAETLCPACPMCTGQTLEQNVFKHACKPPLGNPTREEAIAALHRISDLVTTENHDWPEFLNDHYGALFKAILTEARRWPE